MKKRILRLMAVILSLVMVCASVPVSSYAANTKVVRLSLAKGKDFATEFNKLTDIQRYCKSNQYLKIIVKPGKYNAKSQIRLYSNTTVDFTGSVIYHKTASSTMLRLGRKGAEWDKYNKGKGRPGYSGYKNITIIGGTFDGCGYNQAHMRFGHSSNIKVTGATFTNVKNSHMIEAGACENITIEKCTFMNFTGDWGTSRNHEAVQFDITAGGHFGGYNPDNDETPCRNCKVKNCTFKNLQRGVGTHAGVANTYFTNMEISGNTFENITGYAITAINYLNGKINNNTIKNCGSGIVYRTCMQNHGNFYASKKHSNAHAKYVKMNAVISGNSISITPGYKAKYKNVAYAIRLEGENLKKKAGTVPAGDFRCAGVTVSNNKIWFNCTGYAIWLTGTAENTIKGNTVSCNIKLKSAGGTGNGIHLSASSKNTVSGNTVMNRTTKGHDGSMSGIVMTAASDSNSICSNKITGAVKNGILIQKSTGNTCHKNTVLKSGKNGIGLYGAKKTVLTNNTVTDAKAYGIYTSTSHKTAIAKDAGNKLTKCKKKARSWAK